MKTIFTGKEIPKETEIKMKNAEDIEEKRKIDISKWKILRNKNILRPIIKGFFRKETLCPFSNNKLNKNVISDDLNGIKFIFNCNCGYEYAHSDIGNDARL